jgi:hypothetical protein
MRRAASLSHNAEIIRILSAAADEAEADAADMESDLQRKVQHSPPQT